MENYKNNEYNEKRIDRELIIFDNGFTEIAYNEKGNIKKNKISLKRQNINWFTLYLLIFKNTLNSKYLVPFEELKLRINILRKYLLPYYNCPKNNEKSNSNSIMKRFTFHIYSKNINLLKKIIENKNKKKLFHFDDDENSSDSEKENKKIQRRFAKTRTEKFSFSKFRSFLISDEKILSSKRKSKFIFNDIPIIHENNSNDNNSEERKNQNKKKSIKVSMGLGFNFKNAKKKVFIENETNKIVRFDNDINELNNIANNTDILIRTPLDKEYPLILTEKKTINKNPTYFMDILSKLNEETKNEKVTKYKKESMSQILKFNDIYFDNKIDDFSKDNQFKEIKNMCELLINKFNLDNQEEKNLGDVDKFL